MVKEMKACSVCGALHPVGELTEFEDSWLCSCCLRTETIICQDCGERIWTDDNAGDSDTPLCRRCYDRNYTSCEDCGRVLHHSDAYYIDDDSFDARCYHCHCRHANQRVIRDYYYKPEPEFFGDGGRWFGVELEVDDAGEKHSNAARIESAANCGEERIYCKHDGSLNAGFEIVTHPMTLGYHLNKMPWAEILNGALVRADY